MNFVFMGNFFHRGENGVGTFSLLLALKVRYKGQVTLLRGLGEEEQSSLLYGFYDECERKYGNPNVWKIFVELFRYFPLSAVVDDTVKIECFIDLFNTELVLLYTRRLGPSCFQN